MGFMSRIKISGCRNLVLHPRITHPGTPMMIPHPRNRVTCERSRRKLGISETQGSPESDTKSTDSGRKDYDFGVRNDVPAMRIHDFRDAES